MRRWSGPIGAALAGIVFAVSLILIGAAPFQEPLLVNSQTTGAADTAVVVTVAAAVDKRAHLYTVDARCSASTSNVTVQDGGTTIFSTPAAEVGTARLRLQWPVPLTGAPNSALTVTLATCGVGNTGTLSVQSDRY